MNQTIHFFLGGWLATKVVWRGCPLERPSWSYKYYFQRCLDSELICVPNIFENQLMICGMISLHVSVHGLHVVSSISHGSVRLPPCRLALDPHLCHSGGRTWAQLWTLKRWTLERWALLGSFALRTHSNGLQSFSLTCLHTVTWEPWKQFTLVHRF